MSDFVENLKKGAEKAFDGAENVTKAAIKKTSETVSTMKLNYSIRDIEKNIDGLYKELGRMLYNEFLQNAGFEGEYSEKCGKISECYDEISVLKAKVAEISSKQICPECGEYNDAGARFCSSCGKEFE